MNRVKLEISRDEIYGDYVVNQLSISKIARKYNVSNGCIRKRLIDYNIDRRPEGNQRYSGDLSGIKFHDIEVIKPSDVKKSDRCTWECKCKCGKILYIDSTRILKKSLKSCFKCSVKRKGFGDINGSYFAHIKCAAQKRKILLSVSIEEIWNLFIKQGGKCSISGLPLSFAKNYDLDRSLQTASLDRIDSSKDYTIDNVQWLHKVINMMKQALSDEDFILWCHLISDFQRNKNA